MKCKNILEEVEKIMPSYLAMDWDNVGLLIGRTEKEVKKILLCLDVSEEAVKKAAKEKVDLIISHHPMIFSGLKSITDKDANTNKILNLIQNDISYIALHTNYDIAKTCMGEKAAKLLGLKNLEVLEETYGNDKESLGIGKVGIYEDKINITDLSHIVKKAFNIKTVAVYAKDMQKNIEKIAVSPGSGKGMYKAALKKGAEVLISGDISHHEGLDAMEAGVDIIDAGHYGIEKLFIEDMKEKLGGISKEFEIIKCYEEPFDFI